MLDKILLAPYYLTLKLRHACYDHGIFKVGTCEVPTICVGNITAGGTGKTPHTEMILRTLLRSDDWAFRNIAVLSRGHKRNRGGFQLVESGEAGMLAAVQRAIKRNEWVVFVGWTPHPMNINMKIAYLTGSEDVFGPGEGAATVSVVTAPDYASRCPNVSKLMSNLKFTAAQESQLMVPIMERQSPQDVAKQWLRDHPEDLQRWLAGVTAFDGGDGVAAVQSSLKP